MGRIEPVTPEVTKHIIHLRRNKYGVEEFYFDYEGRRYEFMSGYKEQVKFRDTRSGRQIEGLIYPSYAYMEEGTVLHTIPKAEAGMPNNPVSKKQLEEAKREAEEELRQMIRESGSAKDALEATKNELKLMDIELGRRTIPYGADFWTKRGRYKQRYFADVPGSILYAKFLVYKDFVKELEPIVEEIDECIRIFSYDEVKQMAIAEKISTAGGKTMMCKELWKRGWRVIDRRLQLV